MAHITKKALAASLKKLLAEKPLKKITVNDIAEDCEVNRQTFYYHFQDIYDLLDWVYTNETTKAIDDKKSYDNWQQGFLQIFEYIIKNKVFVANTYNSISRELLERYLYRETYNLLIGVAEEKAKGMLLRDADKEFIANFYKYAFVGLVIDWIQKGMKESPDDIVKRLGILIQGDIVRGIERFRTDKRNLTNS